MKTDIELLENYYNLLKSKTEGREFLLTFLDYMKFVDSKKKFRDFLIQELKTRRALQDQIISIEKSTFEETAQNLLELKKLFPEAVDKNKKFYERFNKIEKIMQDRENKDRTMFFVRVGIEFGWVLTDIFKVYGLEKIKDFAVISSYSKDDVGTKDEQFPNLDRYTRLHNSFDRRQMTETWGVVFTCLALYTALNTMRNWSKELQEEFSLHKYLPSDANFIREGNRFWSSDLMRVIRNEKKPQYSYITRENKEEEDNYNENRFDAERLHNFIMVYISNLQENDEDKQKIKTNKITAITYDEETFILSVCKGKNIQEVELKGKTQRDILINCFGSNFSLRAVYNFEDVMESSFFINEKYSKESLEIALRRINDKVAKEIGIENLISLNAYNFYINKGLL